MRQRRLTGINLLIRRDIDRFRRAEVAIRQGVEEVVEHPAVIERLPVRTEDFLKRQLLDAAPKGILRGKCCCMRLRSS